MEPRKVHHGVQLANQVQDWAAPTARDHFPAHTPAYIAAKKAEGHGMRNLNDEAATWRGPSDLSKRGGSQPPEKRLAGGHSLNLEDQAGKWPGPATRDHKGSSEGSSEGSIIRQDGKSRADMLDFAAEQFFHPPSSPDPATAAGAMSSTAGPNSNQPSQKRKLNPIFVEALMRWPTGLSGFERPGMGSIPSPPLMPSSASPNGFEAWFAVQSAYLATMIASLEAPAQASLFGD